MRLFDLSERIGNHLVHRRSGVSKSVLQADRLDLVDRGGVVAELRRTLPGQWRGALRTVQLFAPPNLCLMRSLAASGRLAGEISAKCCGIERLAWRMNARCFA